MLPHGDLEIRIEYRCGCRIYRDRRGQEFEERGLLCDEGPEHKRRVVRGAEVQPSLF